MRVKNSFLTKPKSTDPRILYVDDEKEAREAFAAAAREQGFLVDLASDGGEALTLVSHHRYAIVATDLRMPALNGLALIQLLRPKWPEPSYFLVTGAANVELPTLANGEPVVDDVLRKPWKLAELADVLSRGLRRHRQRQPTPETSDTDPILLLDSNPVAAELVVDILVRDGTKVVHADRLELLADLLNEHRFRVALVDPRLPGCRGLEAIHHLQDLAPKLPVVALSPVNDETWTLGATQAGAQDCLVKERLDDYNLWRAIRYAIERKTAEERFMHLAHHDQVTGLANRTLFRDRLSLAIRNAQRRESDLAVLFLDLDRFMKVNDSLGHDIGDRLLKQVAQRLLDNVRDVDTVARMGGDEFAILLEDIAGDEWMLETTHRLLEALVPPFKVQGYEVPTTGSIGVALHPEHGDSVSELLKHADAAMYQAKRNGRDGVAVYSGEGEESHSRILERLNLESGLRWALERDELEVFYQPQLTWDRDNLTSAEALLRWRHPKMGLIPPGRFMQFLEATGLINTVGEWVLRTACRQARAWHENGFADMRVSVNLSVRQFESSDLVLVVRRALEEARLDGESLELEITESLLMKDIERTSVILDELKELGTRIAIDDFGTGYSSLSRLAKFPFDALKIDRSFVKDITSDDDNKTVSDAIIGLRHNLRLDVVAEGVETEEQLAMLEGCDGFQEFLVARPQPPVEFERLMAPYRTVESPPVQV